MGVGKGKYWIILILWGILVKCYLLYLLVYRVVNEYMFIISLDLIFCYSEDILRYLLEVIKLL